MTTYRVERFTDRLETDDEEEVVSAQLSEAGTNPARGGVVNFALIEEPPSAESPECGYEGCSRTVSDPNERCWQHED